jgi:hypothetical protein
MRDDAQGSVSGDAASPHQEESAAASGLSWPLRIVESAGFVALVSAIFYFMGYSYYAGFFERISLPPPFPELSTSDYFLRAFFSLDGLIAAVLVSIPYRNSVPTTVWQALWVNSAFIITPLILVQNARANEFLTQGLALFLGAVVVVAVVASAWKRSMMTLLNWRWGLVGAIAYGFGVFLFFAVYFRLQGTADATRLIEGRLEPSSSVVLQTQDPESPLNGARLLVALARDGDFWLVRPEVPAPSAPSVHFVPASEVRSATMQRVSAATATPSP